MDQSVYQLSTTNDLSWRPRIFCRMITSFFPDPAGPDTTNSLEPINPFSTPSSIERRTPEEKISEGSVVLKEKKSFLGLLVDQIKALSKRFT